VFCVVINRLNGPDTCKELRARGVRLPIIGVTGNVLVADKNFFMSHGANAVLHKPLTITNLEILIEQFSKTLDLEVHNGTVSTASPRMMVEVSQPPGHHWQVSTQRPDEDSFSDGDAGNDLELATNDAVT
jgi:DNA-binding response OmpR family regulator